ncbi:hypothetical protein GCM10011344_11800 [Dokdonia pacifica]|uniref:Uncharacterized protein n=1 Tax=Dokdonia pacifica TaxID=1627892 RepID=A0A238YG70_9FLAO|nr:hypothetical protein [Dokdonia pacifica]GGG12730.1 hypothetical protein GCM10011344_11800 [Dokdonia pacifica]SNR69613.1 hypothetical protein SAMN06265376_10213 [Dokdonia pacifica]
MDKHTPEHITQYRYQSWQIEMLIAGGILYGLFTSDKILQAFFVDNYAITDLTTNKIILLFGSFTITKILLIGFAANLFLRAVWLGYLGISFWFPNDINYDRLIGTDYYKETLKTKPTASERLLILEKWCNLSFSFAVLLGFLSISLFITVSAIIWTLGLFSTGYTIADTPTFIYILVFVLIFIQVGVLDKFLLRKKKDRFQFITKLKRGIVRFFSMITLSYFIQREFLVLRTNTNKWLLSSFIIVYLSIAILAAASSIGSFYNSDAAFDFSFFDDREMYDVASTPRTLYNSYMNNLSDGNKIFWGAIQSDIISDDYLQLFVVSWNDFDYYLEDRYAHYDVKQKYPSLPTAKARDSFKLVNTINWQKSMRDLLKVKIDTTTIPNLDWARYRHPITKEEGYITYINISNISHEKHDLELIVHQKFNNNAERDQQWFKFPFWKQ